MAMVAGMSERGSPRNLDEVIPGTSKGISWRRWTCLSKNPIVTTPSVCVFVWWTDTYPKIARHSIDYRLMDPAGRSHGRRRGSYCPNVIKAGIRSFRQVLLIPQDSFHV